MNKQKERPVSYPFYNRTKIDERKKAEADDADNNKKFKNNFVLSEAIDVALSKMVKDAYNDRSKKIPNGFQDFARSEQFKELLEAMLDYNRVSISIN